MELQLQHLSKCYGAKQAVDDVSTVLTPGVYGLLGANGAGKTTLMRMICGVLKPIHRPGHRCSAAEERRLRLHRGCQGQWRLHHCQQP